jgi:hypothetical protein
MIEKEIKKIMKLNFSKKSLLAYKTCDPNHLTEIIKYKKS